MRTAMAGAEVGDDVYGEDPTVNRLERIAAERLGTEAALFASSGTQTNLLALLCHCGRGDEYIVGQQAHTYRYEAGGAAVLGSIQPQPLDFEADGSLDLESVANAVKPDDCHFARTRLLCLENTQAGKVLPLEYLSAAADFASRHGLGLHLDGARIFNAAVKLKVPVAEIAAPFDSISVCLSKGLGAPVGSLLCGPAEFIRTARRWRKMLGGGMRQAGILAAAGIVALEEHVDRLEMDHENALRLANGLADIEELGIDPDTVQTNMVFTSPHVDVSGLVRYLKERGVLIGGYGKIRMVTHLGIADTDIDKVIEVIKAFYLRRN
jgi:threonine aldolase